MTNNFGLLSEYPHSCVYFFFFLLNNVMEIKQRRWINRRDWTGEGNNYESSIDKAQTFPDHEHLSENTVSL